MIKNILYKIFGTRNERLLKQYRRIVSKINQLEPQINKLSDTELQQKTEEFKSRYKKGEELASLLPEVFAVCREAGKRVLNMRHFDVQLIGGMVLHDGKIAEMRTGEGKTLVATLAVYLNSITGNGVHVVTVNDYLAKRDALDMGRLYRFLGLSVGVNLPDMSPQDKQAAYLCDITYGTNNEFGFDYLRDNMVFDVKEKVQRALSFAVVDEVDSILIDEARTPLIISGPANDSTELYLKANQIPQLLKRQEEEGSDDGDFWVDEKNNNVVLSEKGHEKVEQIAIDIGLLEAGDSLYNVQNIGLMHHILSAMKAHYVYFKDQHYVVQDGEVVIVDEFTGRLMSGRRWSDGLHQAVEAKENVSIQRENQTMATVTFQNYFRMYKKLSGMTGTADTEAYEFQQIYGLETVVIPTNKPMVRADNNDKIYMNVVDKYNAIVTDILDCYQKGQPVLVGTTSVENSEVLSNLLTKAKLKHEVLNAKQHAREAEIIEQAGSLAAVTVATNMAGRGTDIILGGSYKPLVSKVEKNDNLSAEDKQKQIDKIMQEWSDKNKKVLDAGGLYIIGTERHESRRIDNQLRGRSGRQGDNGASRFYLSLDDPLLRIFGGERMRGLMQRLGMQQGEAIEHKMLSRSIESAQRKVEAHNFDIRKQLLEYDNVSNDQRRVIYQQRDDILELEDLSPIAIKMLNSVVEQSFDDYIPPKSMPDTWDIEGLERLLKDEYGLSFSIQAKLDADYNVAEHVIKEEIIRLANEQYTKKMSEFATKVNQDLVAFANGVINITNRNLAALDEFCLQNGLSKDFMFTDESISKLTNEEILNKFNSIVSDMGKRQVTRFERGVLLQNIDHHWREHLTQLDQLREGIHLRGYAQKDPKQEYKHESFALFSVMLDNIKRDVAKVFLTVKIQGLEDIPQEFAEESIADAKFIHQDSNLSLSDDPKKGSSGQISRNSSCSCGSGKKYKHCHGKL